MVSSNFENGMVLSLKSAASQSGRPNVVNGVATYRFKKELIHTGNFLTADGQPFKVTPETIKQWAATFSNMRANGVPVPVVADHTVDSDHARGELIGMEAAGDKLFGILEILGPDAPRLAASNDVSIFAEPEWTDGTGTTHHWPIRHVALTPDPRIPGMSGFVPIAASNNAKQIKQVPILRLEGTMPDTTNTVMPGDAPLPTDSPAGNTTTEPNDPMDGVLDAIEQQFLPQIRDASDKPTRVKLAKEMAAKIDAALKLFADDLADDGEANNSVAASDDASLCNAKMSNRSAIHPELVRLSSENRRMKIDELFRTGRITKPQHTQLVAKFANNQAVTLALSSQAAAASFEDTLAVLSQNPQMVQSEISGQQVLTLSNPLRDDPEARKKAEDEEAARWRKNK